MSKIDELRLIDDFIKEFNKPIYKLGNLRRISGVKQESPDAICHLNGELLIGLEATIAVLPEDTPLTFRTKNGKRKNFTSKTTIDLLMTRIKSKSLYDYKEANIDEVWLLVIGGSLISRKRLEDRLAEEQFATRFNRIFIHKGIVGADLIELKTRRTQKISLSSNSRQTNTPDPVLLQSTLDKIERNS